MGTNCRGNNYLSCRDANLCCQKGDKQDREKLKKYQEYMHRNKDMEPESTVMDKMNDDYTDVLDGSNYYESNGEIFCIDDAQTKGSTSKSPKRQIKKVGDLKKVDNI